MATAQPARFLTAEWRFLAMLNFAIDPAVVQPLVPAGTELDCWQGKTLVSVVGFRFRHTRVLGLPIPFHRHFDEVNFRFYVRRRVGADWRRGVVFIKDIAPRRLIAWVARRWYNENYLVLPTRSRIDFSADQGHGTVCYEWFSGRRCNRLTMTTAGAPALPEAGSEAAFITEHYWGYTRQRDGGTLEYQVDHPPWRVWRGATAHLACDVAGLYGQKFVAPLTASPSSAYVAEGSAVVLRRGLRLIGRRS